MGNRDSLVYSNITYGPASQSPSPLTRILPLASFQALCTYQCIFSHGSIPSSLPLSQAFMTQVDVRHGCTVAPAQAQNPPPFPSLPVRPSPLHRLSFGRNGHYHVANAVCGRSFSLALCFIKAQDCIAFYPYTGRALARGVQHPVDSSIFTREAFHASPDSPAFVTFACGKETPTAVAAPQHGESGKSLCKSESMSSW